MLARMIAGTAIRLGNHESRHAGMRRNANARISGVASFATPVMPDSILCAWEVALVVAGSGGSVASSSSATPDAVVPTDGGHSSWGQTSLSPFGVQVGGQVSLDGELVQQDGRWFI